MTKRYGYMIKTVFEKRKRLYGYGKFKYPKKKGAKVVALDWNSRDVYYGGIFGLVHHTQGHYINNRECWLILKYEIGTEVVVSDSKIKVPWALVEAWGGAEEMQKKFEELTGKEYAYNYRVAVKGAAVYLKGGNGSILEAEYLSTLKAGAQSTLTAGDVSTLIAGAESSLKAGAGSTLILYGCEGVFENMDEQKIVCVIHFMGKVYSRKIPKGKFKIAVVAGKLLVKKIKT